MTCIDGRLSRLTVESYSRDLKFRPAAGEASCRCRDRSRRQRELFRELFEVHVPVALVVRAQIGVVNGIAGIHSKIQPLPYAVAFLPPKLLLNESLLILGVVAFSGCRGRASSRSCDCRASPEGNPGKRSSAQTTPAPPCFQPQHMTIENLFSRERAYVR